MVVGYHKRLMVHPLLCGELTPTMVNSLSATKSVFNKVKIKICYTELDILTYYQGDKYSSLVYVLCQCLRYLPKTEGVFQGDFIGHGGSNIYKPNTLVYKFPQVVKEDIIVDHTYYEGNIFPEMVPYPLTDELVSTKNCKSVQPIVDRVADQH